MNRNSNDGDGDDRIASIEKRIRELQARKQRMLAVDRTRERKRGVRRQIILGGGLLERIRKGDTDSFRIAHSIQAGLTRESDKAAFKGWEVPGPAQPETEDKAPEEVSR